MSMDDDFDCYAASWESLARDWLRPEEDVWDDLFAEDAP